MFNIRDKIMKDKFFLRMTDLFGWFGIILVFYFSIIASVGYNFEEYHVIASLVNNYVPVFLLLWLFIRIKFQLKSNTGKKDYFWVFVIDIIYIMILSLSFKMLFPYVLIIIIDCFVYMLRASNIKPVFISIILLLINIVLFYFVIFGFSFCAESIYNLIESAFLNR